jgi:hypothetical protein
VEKLKSLDTTDFAWPNPLCLKDGRRRPSARDSCEQRGRHLLRPLLESRQLGQGPLELPGPPPQPRALRLGGRKQGWPTEIARLTATHEHLYADIGNHALGEIEETLGALGGLFRSPETATMRGRFMFGTDWFMVASNRDYESSLDRWRDDYRAAFPDDVDRFLGGAALSFLGFDDPQNRNRARLRARYEQHSHTVPAWLGG